MQVVTVCKVEAFVSSKMRWLSGASGRNSPAESTLSLPSLYNFELLKIFKESGSTVENGPVFRFLVGKCLSKMMIEIRVVLEELSGIQ